MDKKTWIETLGFNRIEVIYIAEMIERDSGGYKKVEIQKEKQKPKLPKIEKDRKR